MLSGARSQTVGESTTSPVRAVTSLAGRTLVTVDGPAGPVDLVVRVAPDAGAAAVATAGLWRLQWVCLDLRGPAPHARLAGTTRHPHVREVPLAAGLALAARGLPAFVVGEGD